MKTLDSVDAAQKRSDIPDFRPGDTLKVHVKVVEGNKTRVQVFQGVVIARSGSGINETFTVRKVSYGVGVERIFPLHTPIIEKIEVVTRGDVRRAKLYYLRELRGKKAKIRERIRERIKERMKEGQGHKGGPKGNNGVGNGVDPQPPGDPKVNDGEGTGPGHPGNRTVQ